MLVGTLTPNGLINTKEVKQETLTSDCWLVQFDGLLACKSCEAYGTDDCGGGGALLRLNNAGY